MIRAARIGDIPSLVEIARLQAAALYPRLRFDADKVKKAATEVISSASHFCHVVETDGKVEGCIAVSVTENLWAERKHGHILFWVGIRPMSGVALLRAFLSWVETRRAVRFVGFSPDADIDPRIEKLLKRFGFEQAGKTLLLWN